MLARVIDLGKDLVFGLASNSILWGSFHKYKRSNDRKRPGIWIRFQLNSNVKFTHVQEFERSL